MQQTVKGREIGTIKGILLVGGIIAALVVQPAAGRAELPMAVLAGQLHPALEVYVSNLLGTIVFWASGATLAYLVMRNVIMSYLYTYNGMVMRIERCYGKKPRFIEDVSVRHLNGIGTLEEMKKRYPHATVVRATVRRCDIPELAVAYTNAEGQRIAVIQPDEAMREKLYANLKK